MMELNMFYAHLRTIPTIAFIISVILKGIVYRFDSGKFKLKQSVGSGGMPSAHSAVMTSLAAAIAIKYGFNSDLFAITVTIAVIVIYDAVNVRYQAGLHAKALNKILNKDKYNESLGHLPSEALAGCALGILVSTILFFI